MIARSPRKPVRVPLTCGGFVLLPVAGFLAPGIGAAGLPWLVLLLGGLLLLAAATLAAVAVFNNITKRKLAEAALRQTDEQFRSVFDLASVGIAQADPHTGRWLRLNREMSRITGYSAEELLSMNLRDITHPDDRQADWEAFQRVVRGEIPRYRLEKRYLRKDGSPVWVNVNMTILRDAAGHPVRTVATIEDIAERKHAEFAQRESEERLRFALQKGHTGGWDLDLADHTAIRTPEHDRIFGYPELLPQWTYEMFLEHVLPEDRAAVDHTFQQAIAEKKDWNFECRIRRADGQVRWIRASGGYRIDEHGPSSHLAGIVRDITEQKTAQETLAANEERYRSLFENMLNGFAYCRMIFEGDEPRDFVYLAVNRAFGTLTGLRNVVGKKVSEVIPGILESDPLIIQL